MEKLDQLAWKRIGLFLAVAFGWSYSVGLLIYWFGGLQNPTVWFGGVLNSYVVLAAVLYMPAPALAHVVTRWATQEGWTDLQLQPKIKRGWPYWLVGWLGTAVLILVGGALFYLLYPQYFDPQMQTMGTALAEADPATAAIPTPVIALIQAALALPLSLVINGLFVFGEEFGWRGYLQQKLLPLGPRPAMLLMGLIWGLWHAPLIAMGHNYGLDYPGAPWLGIAMMCWLTFGLGTFWGWLVLRAGSVWPAVWGHAITNGFGGIVMFTLQGEPSPLLGPLVPSFFGAMGFGLVAIFLLIRSDWWVMPDEVVSEQSPVMEQAREFTHESRV